MSLASEFAKLRCDDPGCYACARYPSAGPTARWIKPVSPSQVRCPTCREIVDLALWWSHGCGQVASPLADDTDRRRAPTIETRGARWQGDVPRACQNPGCAVPLRETFWDGVLPDGNGHTHGLYCDLCHMTRGPVGAPVRYHKARGSKVWRKVQR